jgi:hypothetical protein
MWATLHPVSMVWGDLWRHVRAAQIKGVLYELYVLANGVSFHLAGWQTRFPLNRRRMESFQTSSGIRRALKDAGFEKIEILKGRFFVAKAMKP